MSYKLPIGDDKNIAMIKSAIRHFLLTAAAVWVAAPESDLKAVLFGAAAAIVGPALRGLDKKDPSFGLVGQWISVEFDKLAKADKKKKSK